MRCIEHVFAPCLASATDVFREHRCSQRLRLFHTHKRARARVSSVYLCVQYINITVSVIYDRIYTHTCVGLYVINYLTS
jgi:hypothetical protein